MRTLFVFTSPLALTVWVLMLGTSLLWHRRWHRRGRWLVLAGVASLALQSMTPLGSSLLGSLEFRHPKLDESAADLPKQIVVLGGGVQPGDELPLVSQLSPSSLERLVEGVRLYHRNPEHRLLLSGGGGRAVPEAEVMARLARELGVPADHLTIESETFNTGEQALMLARRLPDQPFVLVTSAAHMPRSMAAVTSLGLNAIPAPVGHQTYHSADDQPEDRAPLLGPPHPDGIRFCQQVAYERLGRWRTLWQTRNRK